MFDNLIKFPVLGCTEAKIYILGREKEKEDIFYVEKHTLISKSKKLYAIIIDKSSFSYNLLKKAQVCTLNFLPKNKKKQIEYCKKYSGEFIDKFEKTKLKQSESEKIHCHYISESYLSFECELVNEIEFENDSMLVLKIIYSHEKKASPFVEFKKSYLS